MGQATQLLIWETEVVKAEPGRAIVQARKPLHTMSAKQAARVLGLSVDRVYDLWQAGCLEGSKPGAIARRRDGRASNAKLVLDAESVLRWKERAAS